MKANRSQHVTVKGAHVHETLVSVTFGAPRRSVPLGLLETCLATWAAQTGQEFRSASDPSGITSPRSPRSASGNFTRPHHEHLQTSHLVSSVAGCAMHMKWLDGIGRGSWDCENPRQESANEIPALPVLTGHAIWCPRAGGSGQARL